MSELLLEILSEEIPSRFHNSARDQFFSIVEKEFKKHVIQVKDLEVYVSPRRLVLSCRDVKQGKIEPKRGPRTDAKEVAIEGFARSCGISVKALDKKKIDGIEYYFSSESGNYNSVEESVCKILERSLSQISWPKSMYWNDRDIRWVRPIRNIMAIFNEKVLSLKFCDIEANNISYGHKVMCPDSFIVRNFKQYQEELFSRKVILSSEQKKEIIIDHIQKISKKLDVIHVDNVALLEEIIGLVEYPVVQYGTMDKKFLSLPKEVIIRIMATHQKFIALENKDGALAPYFITVLNVDFPDSVTDIIKGTEKVLNARLYDGKFFFEEDIKIPLKDRVEDLQKIVFHGKLGTLFDKVNRIEKIATYLSDFTDVDKKKLSRAVLLSKADLTTYMVNEFPELQGVIGQYYAQHNGESKDISQAIYEHYLPIGKDSDCPKSSYGALISIADKIDTIVSLFLVNEIPTSSKDPYALRRCALGMIRVICDVSLDVNLENLIKYSFDLHKKKYSSEQVFKVLEFIYERFRYWLKLDTRDDFVASVLSYKSAFIDKEYRTLLFLKKMFDVKKEVFFIFKRVNNIVDGNSYDAVNKKFITDVESKLLKEISVLENSIENFYSKNIVDDLINIFINIEKTVVELFDNTMILDKNLEIRKHRISILKELYVVSKKIADFSLIDL